MEVSDQLHALAALNPGTDFPVAIVYEAGWAAEPVWTQWSRGKSLAPAENRRSAKQTELFRLQSDQSR
jgi:hypothetical protein